MKTYRQRVNATFGIAFEGILSDSGADILSFVPCEGISSLRLSFLIVDSGCWIEDRKNISENIIDGLPMTKLYTLQAHAVVKIKLPRVWKFYGVGFSRSQGAWFSHEKGQATACPF